MKGLRGTSARRCSGLRGAPTVAALRCAGPTLARRWITDVQGTRSARTAATAAFVGVAVIVCLVGAPVDAVVADDGAVVTELVHPVPAPGELVPAGRVDIGIDVPAGSLVEIRVGGALVTDIEMRDVGARHRASGSAELTAGAHLVAVTAVTPAGVTRERTWTIAATDATVERLAGSGRVETAVAISRAGIADHAAGGAVVVRADDFADALAGTPLAAAVDGPLLLSGSARLDPATAAELRRVLAPGTTVHLLGGVAALGDGVARDVAELGFEVERVAGSDRLATAAAVARLLGDHDHAVVASGSGFADALAAAGPAAAEGAPVLLVAGEALGQQAAAALERRGVRRVTVVGGPAAVPERVVADIRELGIDVVRIAGADRWETAAALAWEWPTPAPSDDDAVSRARPVALASGTDFPDALAGSAHAARIGAPLLLTAADDLPTATRRVLQGPDVDQVIVYGGAAAIAAGPVSAAWRASAAGPDAPVVTGSEPAAGDRRSLLRSVRIDVDGVFDVARSSLHLEVGDLEIPVAGIRRDGGALVGELPAAAWDTVDIGVHPARLLAAVAGPATTAHEVIELTAVRSDPIYATTGGIALHLPSAGVELIGFHQANHPGAQQQDIVAELVPSVTLPSRGRGTPSRSAADVVTDPAEAIVSPVSGRVVRAGSYVLYCRHNDEFAVIDPDDRPGWEVKVLHVHGVTVAPGDRVAAGDVIAAGPRALPFASQVDKESADANWPHVHVEVVDPSIPPAPGGGC